MNTTGPILVMLSDIKAKKHPTAEQLARRRSKPGYVYFVRCSVTGLVKIGWAKDPNQRARTLQIGSASVLELEGVVPGGISTERCLHNSLKDRRVRGEWFELSRQEVANILSLADA